VLRISAGLRVATSLVDAGVDENMSLTSELVGVLLVEGVPTFGVISATVETFQVDSSVAGDLALFLGLVLRLFGDDASATTSFASLSLSTYI